MTGLDTAVAAREVLVVCGAGGVGKTTTAAAVAARVSMELSAKVLVLTIDPARRLADAMGLEAIGNKEVRVEGVGAVGGTAPRGELWAAMLDATASWDDLVRTHAPDGATRDAILANQLYRNLTSRLVHSNDYVAVERLHELRQSGRYDLIVVDTPPSRHALDFLEAPSRMVDFFQSPLQRWLMAPAATRLGGLAARSFAAVADRLLGSTFVRDIAQFFTLFNTLAAGVVQRAGEVERDLTGPRTGYVVVTTAEEVPASEAGLLVDELHRRRLEVVAVVANRVQPSALLEREPTAAARHLATEADEAARAIGAGRRSTAAETTARGRVLQAAARSFLDRRAAASLEAATLDRLAVERGELVRVPWLGGDITDLEGLLALAEHLW